MVWLSAGQWVHGDVVHPVAGRAGEAGVASARDCFFAGE